MYKQIKIKSDSVPIRYVENGLECVNGDFIRADVIVFCTGFLGNLRVIVGGIFGSDVASQVDDFWGLDEEGELKGAFKFSGRKLVLTVTLFLFFLNEHPETQIQGFSITEAL